MAALYICIRWMWLHILTQPAKHHSPPPPPQYWVSVRNDGGRRITWCVYACEWVCSTGLSHSKPTRRAESTRWVGPRFLSWQFGYRTWKHSHPLTAKVKPNSTQALDLWMFDYWNSDKENIYYIFIITFCNDLNIKDSCFIYIYIFVLIIMCTCLCLTLLFYFSSEYF